jgi:hypothetical protein
MSLSLDGRVEIELLIEGERRELFNKLANGHEPVPLGEKDPSAWESTTDFYVLDVYGDEKEFVFEVANASMKVRYYAFEYKEDYYCCPAFLADNTHYRSVLTVKTATFCLYYVFLEKSRLPPLSSILGSKWEAGRHFRFDASEFELYQLDYDKLDFKCFIGKVSREGRKERLQLPNNQIL